MVLLADDSTDTSSLKIGTNSATTTDGNGNGKRKQGSASSGSFAQPMLPYKSSSQQANQANSTGNSSTTPGNPDDSPGSSVHSRPKEALPSSRVEGPTSISFLLHSTAAIPRNIVDSYDLKHHTTWHIISDEGDGLVSVSNPPPSSSFQTGHTPDQGGEGGKDSKAILSAELISSLVNAYFDHINPLLPIVSKLEFCKEHNPPPLLLYAMAGVASARRGLPRQVFVAIRTVINGIIRNNDVLSDSTFYNVQALVSAERVAFRP